jgi:hypothetical protein
MVGVSNYKVLCYNSSPVVVWPWTTDLKIDKKAKIENTQR